MTAPILVWLRRDLRLADHPALAAAAVEGPVVLAFCLDEQGGRPFGGASRWWLHQSLARLGNVTLALGRSEQEIPRLVLACGARAVYWNQSADPVLRATEDRVRQALTVPCRIFPATPCSPQAACGAKAAVSSKSLPPFGVPPWPCRRQPDHCRPQVICV